jgi:DNA-binding GntR family transcriptional regulator
MSEPSLAALTPVGPDATASVSEAVTKTLRTAILTGRLRPGDRLLQVTLAEQLRVSRQPVREALQRLKDEGLVVRRMPHGVTVRKVTDEDIRENYHLRALLESEAARFAADRVESDQIKQLKILNRTMSEAATFGDISDLVDLNTQFHRRVHEAARMPILVRLIGQLWGGRTIFTPLFVPGRATRAVAEHDALIAAFEAHDPEKAASAMRDHIRRAEEEYFAQSAQIGTPVIGPPE